MAIKKSVSCFKILIFIRGSTRKFVMLSFKNGNPMTHSGDQKSQKSVFNSDDELVIRVGNSAMLGTVITKLYLDKPRLDCFMLAANPLSVLQSLFQALSPSQNQHLQKFRHFQLPGLMSEMMYAQFQVLIQSYRLRFPIQLRF